MFTIESILIYLLPTCIYSDYIIQFCFIQILFISHSKHNAYSETPKKYTTI